MVINALSLYIFNFLDKSYIDSIISVFSNKQLLFSTYISFFWLFFAYVIGFYKVYRFTLLTKIIALITQQGVIFTGVVFSFIGVFRIADIQASLTLSYIALCLSFIGSLKIGSYFILKKIRLLLDGNIRNVLIIGQGAGAKKLKQLFNRKKELGYRLIIPKKKNDELIQESDFLEQIQYIKNHPNVDEIYCAIDELSEKQINDCVKYASINKSNIKFIPNKLNDYTKNLKTQYYNYIPVLSLREVALNNDINKIIKRTFDIVFSAFIIVFILSWLTPILALLIKIESKGPVFFKHKRHGKNYIEFTCYKFRSLAVNTQVDYKHVKENDQRVTRVGRFIRKTSIDELPQFLNSFLGTMSVVGPRPHMVSYNSIYSKKIDPYKFTFRHSVKSGITGLAQVKGFRGEVKSDSDIINRIKYDIFYIENWTLFLDIKIIFETLVNLIKGDFKAY